MLLGMDLFKYKMKKTTTAGSKVLFLSVKNDTGQRRKILWLIRSKNLKIEYDKKKGKKVESGKFLLVEKIQNLRQLTLLHQQQRKRKPNVGDMIKRHVIFFNFNCQRFKYR